MAATHSPLINNKPRQHQKYITHPPATPQQLLYLFLSLSLCLFVVSLTFLRSFVKHQYHSKIDDQIDKALASMTQGLINKLVSVLEGVLSKLGRYDEGSLIGSFLSFTVS
jgi:hypothetical protein